MSSTPGEVSATRRPVILVERVRENAAATLAYFTAQQVAVKILFGDKPRTVAGVAAELGVPEVTLAADAVDARTLPADPAALADVVEAHAAFGRVSPTRSGTPSRPCSSAGTSSP